MAPALRIYGTEYIFQGQGGDEESPIAQSSLLVNQQSLPLHDIIQQQIKPKVRRRRKGIIKIRVEVNKIKKMQ